MRRASSVARVVPGLRDRFTTLVPDGFTDLARPALEIARIAYPDLDPAPSLHALDELAAAARPSIVAAPDPAAAADALATFLFGQCGFRGNQDDYYDPRNSFLNDVLARRLGIPISLSVVMIEIGRRCGLRLDGVGFPGHFLVGTRSRDGMVLLDPFHAGVRLEEQDLLARLRALSAGTRSAPAFAHVPAEFVTPTPPPAILARMLRNLLRIWQEKDDTPAALAAVDLLLVLTPDATDELRTRGTLFAALECFAAAADDFRRFLELVPDGPEATDVRKKLSRLVDVVPTLH